MDEKKPGKPAAGAFRDKRKWQIALRRYVLEQQKVSTYAPYFGLDILSFRKWIEVQFDNDINWENFGKGWQFDHLIPVGYFDFNNEADLKLGWSFINVRVQKLANNGNDARRVDLLTAKAYFEDLYKETGLPLCHKMIEKIKQLEVSPAQSEPSLKSFIKENYDYLAAIESYSAYEFEQLNLGVKTEDIDLEKAMLLKFGK